MSIELSQSELERTQDNCSGIFTHCNSGLVAWVDAMSRFTPYSIETVLPASQYQKISKPTKKPLRKIGYRLVDALELKR